MGALIRLVLKLINKEHLFLTNYEKAHPHRIWYLLADAVVTVALAAIVLPTLMPGSQAVAETRLAQNSGLVAMRATEIASHVREGGVPVYWLGPISGSLYAPNWQTPHVKTVTYLPNGQSDISALGTPLVRVVTFSSIQAYQANNPLYADDTSKGIDSHGNTYFYDAQFMNSEKIVFKDRPEVIEIDYPSWQSASTMAENADKLILLS